MRPSSQCARSVRLALAGALGVLLVACAEAPTDPAATFGHIDKGQGHGKVEGDPTVTVLQQPVVSNNPNGASCWIDYGFRIDNVQGSIRWVVRWVRGDHPGQAVNSSADERGNPWVPASQINAKELEERFGHHDETAFGEAHSFEALRILVFDRQGNLIADAPTDGAEVSCAE